MPWGCTACGGENPDGTRFCGHCGARASVSETPSASSTADEQRLVTALFADIYSGHGVSYVPGGNVPIIPGRQLQFEEDLGHYDTPTNADGAPQASCTGWDYTLTVYPGSDTSLAPVGKQTFQGDGTTSQIKFVVDLDYSKSSAQPSGTVCVVGENGPHGGPILERAPDANCYSMTNGVLPGSGFH